MTKRKNIIYSSLVVAGLLIILNFIASVFFLRADFTEDKRYTLDRSTKRILREVEKPIIMTLYVSENLPPDVNRTVQDLKSLLTEYNHYSKRKINFEYVNPNANEELEKEAIEAGINPVPLEVREKDQIKVQRVFLGMSIQVGDQSEIIPLIKPGIVMEYTLSTLIKRLTIKNKPKVGYIIGHGEPELAKMEQAIKELSILYDIEPVSLLSQSNLTDYKSLLLIGPMATISTSQFRRLDNYLAQGGNLFIAIERVNGMLNDGIGVSVDTGLEKWLLLKGIHVDDSFIVDKKCGTVTVHQQGYFSFPQQINFPFLPVISNFSNHSITDGLETVVLQFASPISYLGDTLLEYKPLAYTSSISGKLKAPISFNIGRVWRTHDFLFPELTVAATLKGKMGGEKEARICVIGDGNFIVNGTGANKIAIQQDNINFMANSIDWLSDDSGLMSLRTKGISSRPLNQITDGKVFMLKYLNFLLPLVLLITYGLIRFRRRSLRRSKRMKPGFIK
ncbi:MAG: GldG family protein [Labilibaculum sp.]|nr:GldG family protein [Labilibaculum sp.]MBI9056286.1 GldG family protein [Labilibaculum sp.]